MREQPGWKQHALVFLLLATLIAAAYGNSLDGGFAYDNRFQILEDSRLRAVTAENVRRLFTEDLWWPRGVSGLYRPVTKVTFLANYALLGNGERALGYHLVNLAIHLLNALLVYRLALDIEMPFMAAFWSAAFFATHPIGTEAVTNLVGRADLLAALAVLGGLLLYRHLQARPHVSRLAALGAMSGFGVLAKENAAILPGMMVLSDVTFRRRPAVKGYVAVALPLLAVWLWRAHLYANMPVVDRPFVDNPLVAADFWTARLTAFNVLARYVFLLVWPATLANDYAYRQIAPASWTDPIALAGLALVATLVVVAVRAQRRAPAVAFLIGFFFVALLPISNLLFPIGSIMAERFLYLPLVGFAAVIALVIPLILRQPRLAAVLSGCIVLAYCGRTALRNRDWEDSLHLWSSAVAAVPESFRAHQSLALALFHGGDLEAAIAEGERARTILAGLPPDHTDPTTLYELGRFYAAKAEHAGPDRTSWYERAAEVLGEAATANRVRSAVFRARAEALGRSPDDIVDFGDSRIFYHYAGALSALGRPREAIEPLRWACHLSPDEVVPYNALGRAHLMAGEPEAAALVLLEALDLEPRNSETLGLLAHAMHAIPDAGCTRLIADGRLALDRNCPWLAARACPARRSLVTKLRAAHATARADAIMAEDGNCSDAP
jgi:tetratricopeptide (TPR) repeat protein